MASGPSSHHQSIEEMVTCPICMEQMDSPKHLSCQHAFCMACLQDWTEQPGNSAWSVSCPVCRKKTQIASGVQSLPTDINITRLIDVLNSHVEAMDVGSKPEPPVDATAHRCANDKATSVAFCETCKDHLCMKCMKFHQKEQAFENHFVRALVLNCKVHPMKMLDFFCPRCKKMVCSTCLHGPHNRHGCKAVMQQAKINRGVIKKQWERLQAKWASFGNRNSEDDDVSFAEMNSLIENHEVKGKQALEAWKSRILGEVRQLREVNTKEKSEKQHQLAACENLLCYISEFLKPTSENEIVSSYAHLIERLSKAQKSLDCFNSSSCGNTIKNTIFMPETIPQSYGRLKSADEPDVEAMSLGSSTSTGSFHSLGAVRPMGPDLYPNGNPASPSVGPGTYPHGNPASPTMGAGLYRNINPASPFVSFNEPTAPDLRQIQPPSPVPRNVSQAQPQLIKYEFDIMDERWSSTDFSYIRKIHNEENVATSFGQAAVGIIQWMSGSKAEDAFAPVDIAFDSNRGFLYVLERGWFTPGSIKRYHFPRDHTMGNPRVVMNELTAYVLAVCEDSGTVAACVSDAVYTHIRGTIPTQKGPGELIPVDKVFAHTIRSPRGIAVCGNDTWIVVDHVYSVVGVYRLEGGVKNFKHKITFGSKGNLDGQFLGPTNVCGDCHRDRIYVSDTGNHRVQAFTMKGEFLWKTGGKGDNHGEFNTPHGLCIDGAGYVLVADTGNKRIQVISWRNGQFLKSISTDILSLRNVSPFNVALYSPRDSQEAYLGISGLIDRMPVVSLLKYAKNSRAVHRSTSAEFVYVDYGEEYEARYEDW